MHLPWQSLNGWPFPHSGSSFLSAQASLRQSLPQEMHWSTLNGMVLAQFRQPFITFLFFWYFWQAAAPTGLGCRMQALKQVLNGCSLWQAPPSFLFAQ
eukprot:CAMPEP_0171205308 /NCGR_PEP_ID=MMETSP0790-20130122/26483_1 /TAXON_ID=2925 /ORGANISM="Alexandrium catenella, Strain OF101" /LENGTH=97 /DNA_ID=CAMNT_0011670823 /DNA_START=126 /DNA_END=419 /DNA_ORIENTATION=-